MTDIGIQNAHSKKDSAMKTVQVALTGIATLGVLAVLAIIVGDFAHSATFGVASELAQLPKHMYQ